MAWQRSSAACFVVGISRGAGRVSVLASGVRRLFSAGTTWAMRDKRERTLTHQATSFEHRPVAEPARMLTCATERDNAFADGVGHFVELGCVARGDSMLR